MLRERRTDVNREIESPRILDTAKVQDLRAHCSEFEHLLIGDNIQFPRCRDHPGIGTEHTIDIGVDLADRGLKRRGQRHSRGVGPATTQRREVLRVLSHTLKPGHDRDRTLLEGLRYPPGRDVDNACSTVSRIGDESGLGAGVRPGVLTEIGDRHGQERHGDSLSRCEEHVELACRRLRRYLLC